MVKFNQDSLLSLNMHLYKLKLPTRIKINTLLITEMKD